jgi:hypothetical protein
MDTRKKNIDKSSNEKPKRPTWNSLNQGTVIPSTSMALARRNEGSSRPASLFPRLHLVYPFESSPEPDPEWVKAHGRLSEAEWVLGYGEEISALYPL